MMRMALSLGFPHYELMLDRMTHRQYVELQAYFDLEFEKERSRTEKRQQLESEKADIEMREFLRTKMRKQRQRHK